MVLQRWDPFRTMRRMDRRANRFWRAYGIGDELAARALPLDVIQQEEEMVVQASLPGFKADDIDVTIEDGLLRITAESQSDQEDRKGSYLVRERRSGKLQRALRLPDSVDAEKARTRYVDGVLSVTFPRLEATKAKRLQIEVD